MAGNFKYLKMIILLSFVVGCNNIKQQKEIGKSLINDNIDLFVINLYRLPSKNAPIYITKEVGGHDFILVHCESIIEMGSLNLAEDCKKKLFELINKENFKIDEDTKYTTLSLERFPNNNQNIKLITKDQNIKDKEYTKIIFSNLYIDNRKGKAFIIVEESDISAETKGGKTDIYFFEKKNSKWFYVKRHMLLTA